MLFGEKLKKLRLGAGLSQTELASRLGVTRRSIIYYESCNRYPKSREIIMKAASCFNVTVDCLIDDNDAFIIRAGEKYGDRGQRDALELVDEIGVLFAGGKLDDNDKDKVFKAISDIYWQSKEINQKYSSGSEKNK